MRPSVCVIIVSWNARPLLERCLPSVVATRYPNLEIVLADNGSDDGSVAWVEASLPSVRIIRHGANLGFCAGNNRAIEQTSSDYVVLLNNDVEVEPDWLEHLVDVAESDPAVGAAQPKLLQYDARNRFEYAGAAGGHLDRFGYPFARGRVFAILEDDNGQYDEEDDVFWASGAAMLLRRSALEKTGLLDERFEFHMEEIDLCWRLKRFGYRVKVASRARAYHIGGGSLPQGSARKARYNFRNSLLMLYKNLPPGRWWPTFAARLLLDTAAGLRFVATGEFGQAWAIPQAYLEAHRMKSDYRQPTAQEAVPPSYGRSIAIDHYLRGLRRFSDLPRSAFHDPPSGSDARID